MFTQRPEGNFQFIPGGATYCTGVVAHPGYGIAHATFRQPTPLVQAFETARQHLAALGRPMAALCGAEVRIPEPLTFDGFGALNKGYIALLEEHGLMLDGKGTLTRTNVAPLPASVAPAEPCLYAFSYTFPESPVNTRPSFVGSGMGELRPGPATRENIVRAGETTPEAMRAKAEYVMSEMDAQLGKLGVTWTDVTNVNLYTAHPVHAFLEDVVLETLGPAAIYGVHWFFSRPPIVEIEFEADARGTRQELFL
jgi:hypothetical protein